MNPIQEKLIIELDKPVYGDPWFGSSLKNILEDVKSKNAFIKLNTATHSIAEIILHLTAWIEEVDSRLIGNAPKEPKRGDWITIDEQSDMSWEAINNNFLCAHKNLIETVKNFSFENFENLVGQERNTELGTGFNFREMLVGLMQHNIYHFGQIAFINKSLIND